MTTTVRRPPAEVAHAPEGPELVLWEWDAEKYWTAAKAGFFDGQRVELLDGQVVVMAPIGHRHGWSQGRLTALLNRRLDPERWTVGGQSTVDAGLKDMPEPDAYVGRGGPEVYTERLMTPADLVLVVEVADSSLVYDRGHKRRLYERTGVPEYWIVDLRDLCVEVHRSLEGGTYRSVVRVDRGGEVILGRDGQADGQELARIGVDEVIASSW